MTNADMTTCYNMSLKDLSIPASVIFSRFVSFSFFNISHPVSKVDRYLHSNKTDSQAMSKFIVASRQATDLDKTRILLEKRVKEVKDESKRWAEVAAKAKEEKKELQNQIEELKADAIEKDTRLDHFQKRNDELSALLKKSKDDAVVEFKASKQYTDLLDTNHAAEFEDFKMDAMENFPNVDFSSIKLNLAGAPTSSRLQTSSEDVNIEDDATTQPCQDNQNINAPPA